MNAPEAMVPANSLVSEVGVLGGLLIDNEAWGKVGDLLTPADFYTKKHKIIFAAISELLNAGDPVDVFILEEFLERKGHLETVGGLSYLGGLVLQTPSAVNIAKYAEIVAEKSSLRQTLALANKIRSMALDPAAEARLVLSEMEKAVFDLAQRNLRGQKGFTPLKTVMQKVVDRMEENFDAPPSGVLGISSGLADLDRLIGGYRPGNLIIQAGRPGMGKSVLALLSAETCARTKGPVAFFSMEMENEEFGERSLSGAASVNLRQIRESWKLHEDEWVRITAGLQKVSHLPLYIDETPALSLSQVRARALKLNAEVSLTHPGGLAMIVVDYLQLMSPEAGGTAANRAGQIEDITRGLKCLAKELKIPIIALSQLNRGLEGRTNKRPILSDLRESGAIEQDADIIIFVYRDELYNEDSPDKGTAELIVGKQRSGPTGTARALFEGQFTRFRDIEDRRYEAEY
jgi:replicative DNA helicase